MTALDFLRGEGRLAADPAADSLVVFGEYGAFLYNPSGAAGAAGSNGDWGAWHRLSAGSAAPPTASSRRRHDPRRLRRRRDAAQPRHRPWPARGCSTTTTSRRRPVLRDHRPRRSPGLPAAGPVRRRRRRRRDVRARPPTAPRGRGCAVGTRARLPRVVRRGAGLGGLPRRARLLIGVWGGIRYSDDGGLSYTLATSDLGMAGYIVWSFTFAPTPAHPFGGVALRRRAGHGACGRPTAPRCYRSDDGGATWSLAHLFTAAETVSRRSAGSERGRGRRCSRRRTAALWAGVGLIGRGRAARGDHAERGRWGDVDACGRGVRGGGRSGVEGERSWR